MHESLHRPDIAPDLETDVAVAYKLYRDTGKTINLSDWWMAFEGSARDEAEVDAEGEGEQNGETNGSKKRKKSTEGDEEEELEDEEEDDEEEEENDPVRRKQARFLRAVGDLAHVGFLLPTSRKAEHVLKSVF